MRSAPDPQIPCLLWPQTIEAKFPDVVREFKDTHAAGLVLHHQRDAVERMRHEGELSELDATSMLDMINKRLKQLYFLPIGSISQTIGLFESSLSSSTTGLGRAIPRLGRRRSLQHGSMQHGILHGAHLVGDMTGGAVDATIKTMGKGRDAVRHVLQRAPSMQELLHFGPKSSKIGKGLSVPRAPRGHKVFPHRHAINVITHAINAITHAIKLVAII